MGKIILVTGGARSGKSEFAEKYAARQGKKIAYVATAEIFDEEMAYRVKLHQQRRPSSWQTYDAPVDAHMAIADAARSGHDMILFDCLTVYLSNILCKIPDISSQEQNYKIVTEKFDKLTAAAKAAIGATTIFVTNEVGAGIVPENKLAREFRDLAGLMNRKIAKSADEVYLSVCGMAINIKERAVDLS